MSLAEPLAVEELYRPRAVEAFGLWQAGSAQVKTYGIRAGTAPFGKNLKDDARSLLRSEGPTQPSVGFAILHRGEEAVWLLLHWWMPGGILAERLWRRPLDGTGAFEPVDRPLMACVWELSVIGFERDCYVETVMSGQGPADYLGRMRPDGWA